MFKIERAFVASASFLVVLLATAIAAQAQTFTTLYRFDGTDGSDPFAPLVQATDGLLYGTTVDGGSSEACPNGCGTIFKISPHGGLTTLYNFCSQSGCIDGESPFAGLLQGPDGSFYGSTGYGGADGFGTIFDVTPSGVLSVLYTSCSQPGCTDGASPSARLVAGSDGSFYGTTIFGGGSNACQQGADGCGTVFKLAPGGSLTTLYGFCSTSGCADGANPYYVALVQGTDGNFYGSTTYGGENCGGAGCGTVFRVTPSGHLTTLHRFCAQGGSECPDGTYPVGLIQGLDGGFYGATNGGGTYGSGTVFRITASGVLTTLYSFCSQNFCPDGAGPFAALVQATDGNLYGTTTNGGGADGGGTIFRMTTSGTLTTLYSFCSRSDCSDGFDPSTMLLQDTNGILYGATQSGGDTGGRCGRSGCGTLFSLSVGLGPFVETQTPDGRVGQPVKILGTDLTGATSVTFNGTAATFTVASPSLITTTVPAGATTGTVQVVTPGGTLSSNVPFRVIQ